MRIESETVHDYMRGLLLENETGEENGYLEDEGDTIKLFRLKKIEQYRKANNEEYDRDNVEMVAKAVRRYDGFYDLIIIKRSR